jgi:hypothetical protein
VVHPSLRILGPMTRVTPTDRDRAVRRLSAITGALTATSLAVTGGMMVLAKHETDTRNEARAEAARAGALQLTTHGGGSTGSSALTATTQAGGGPPATTPALVAAGAVGAIMAPSTAPTTKTATSKKKATTATRPSKAAVGKTQTQTQEPTQQPAPPAPPPVPSSGS